MTSIAPSFRPPVTPPPTKKRSFGEASTASVPQSSKRLQTLKLAGKLSGALQKPSISVQKPSRQSTGLEGHLKLDLEFSEASKATDADEVNRSVQISSDAEYKTLLAERRYLSSKISESWKDPLINGRGFPNLTGALCYRHSLFQALLHIPKFMCWLTEFHKTEDCVSDSPEMCVSCHIRNLIEVYWDSKKKRNDVTQRLKEIDELFNYLGWIPHSQNGHGDPDEQFAWMLNVMRTEIPRNIFGYFDAFHNSILESEIRCAKCGHTSKTRGNDERHLSVPIKVPDLVARHLQLLIKAYMEEVIQGYRCENEQCKRVSDIHRVQKIAYAPDVLLIQLKRFNFRGQKDFSRVQYGVRLDLSPHSANDSLGPLTYDLVAVISHSGTSSFGHYQCIAKTPLGTWYEFEDLTTRPVDTVHVLNPSNIDPDWTPYLLFYERNKASMPPI